MKRLIMFLLVGVAVLASVAIAQPDDDGLERYTEPIVEDIGALPCCETDGGQCLPPEWQCVRATLDSDLGICSSLYGHTVTEVNWSAVATADRISQYFCGVDPSLWVELVVGDAAEAAEAAAAKAAADAAAAAAAGGGACTAGLVVEPGASCIYRGYTFTVSGSGTGSIAFFSSGSVIDARGSTINGVLWNFHASGNSGSNSWTIHVAD